MASVPRLFQPLIVGTLELKHRVVLAPLTRVRASKERVPADIAALYYAQRASTPGTLLISEATMITAKAGSQVNAPGIWNQEQVDAWKNITNAVHAKGSFIYLQLWAQGRASSPQILEESGYPYVSASDVPSPGSSIRPRPLTIAEIQEYVQLYATAASTAVNEARFDGVEIHGANGYLIEQFLQEHTNKRTDQYGGSAENTTRFALEVVDAVTKAIGAERTGLRLSPWFSKEPSRQSLVDTYSYLTTRLRDSYPTLSYIHLIEPRSSDGQTHIPSSDNDFIRDIWADRPFITAGGYDRQLAIDTAEKKGGLIAFGRQYISNPDLPRRLKEDIPLNPYHRETFYMPGDTTGKGYTDYPFAAEASSTTSAANSL